MERSFYFFCIILACLVVVALGKAPSRDRNDKSYKYVCYWGTWSVYRPDDGKFQVEDIDPFLCTHLIYGFVGLGGDNRIRILDGYLDLEENWGRGNFKKFVNLKEKNPHLTLLLAIGGWNEGSEKYSKMAANAGSRKTFIDSCVDLLLKHDFDGLDLDWEYPANRGGVPEDKANFVTLAQEMRTAFDEHGFLLTAAVSAGKATIDTAYDVPKVAEILDFINVMAYDFHGAWETTTGLNAPLYSRPDESETDQRLNVNYSMHYWMELGARPEKLVLGMGTYGRSFTLKDPSDNGLGATALRGGERGPFTREPGTLGYNEICTDVKKGGWSVVWNDWHQTPYATKGDQWVGYDDERSIELKVAFLKSLNLAGAMIWSIETDDFRGKCGRKYPLSNKIVEVLSGGEVVRPTFPPTTQPTPPPTGDDGKPVSTKPPPIKKECVKSGFARDPTDCNKYFECIPAGGGSFSMINYTCPPDTAFDEQQRQCVARAQVPGC